MNAEVERILQDRSNREFGWSYKLHQGQTDYGPLKYGLDVAIEENFIDEKRMAVRIPFADGNSRDGGGDVLECAGIDTSRHRANPICLFNHAKEVVLPIGMAEDPETGEYTVAIDTTNRKASLLCFFYQGKGLKTGDKSREYEHAIFCEQLFDLVAQKMIRSGSIGYQVIEARPIQPDYRRGTPQGLHLLRVLMLEGSLVVLPMNQETVRKVLSMDQVCGKSLSPILVKSLEPYAGKNIVMSYAEKAAGTCGVGQNPKRDGCTAASGEGGSQSGQDYSREQMDQDVASGREEIFRQREIKREKERQVYLQEQAQAQDKLGGMRQNLLLKGINPLKIYGFPKPGQITDDELKKASADIANLYDQEKLTTEQFESLMSVLNQAHAANQNTENKSLHGKSLGPSSQGEKQMSDKKEKNLSTEAKKKNMSKTGTKAYKPGDKVEAGWLDGGYGTVVDVSPDGDLMIAGSDGGTHRNVKPSKVAPKGQSQTSGELARNRQARQATSERQSARGSGGTCEVGQNPKRDGCTPATKNMDEPVEPVVDPVVEPVPDDIPMNEILDEPMGAKVLRRMYGDAKALHQEWSETLPVLADNPNISKMIQQKMKELEREMKTCTKCWKREKAYKELEPLDMDGDGDPDAIVETPEDEMPVETPEEDMDYTDEDIPADMQGEDVEPTPEEVVEGMDNFPDDDDDYEEEVEKSYKRLKSKKIKALLQRGKKSKALAAAQKMLGKKNLDTDPDDNDESENVENLEGEKRLKHLRTRIKDGMAFLKALSEDDSELDDEGRMKAYHYAKSFEDMRGPDRDTDEKGMKCDDDVEQIAPFKSLSDAIKFFKQLSRSKDFGDRHRSEAKYWHRQLEEESGEDEEEIVGSMDQKSFAIDLNEQTKQLEELQALLAQV